MARGLRDPDQPERPKSKRALLEGAVARNVYAGVEFPPDRVKWAQDLTNDILKQSKELHRLLHEAEVGEAHRLMGFDTFDEYARTIFEISRQRLWQLKKHHAVITAMEAAVGVTLSVPEGQTRGMHTPDVLAKVIAFMEAGREQGVDPYVLVDAVIALWGRPNRKQALAMSNVRSFLGAMFVQLAETDTDEHLKYFAHLQTILDATRNQQPEGFAERISEMTQRMTPDRRAQFEAALDDAQTWLSLVQKAVAEAPEAPPKKAGAVRARRALKALPQGS